MDLLLIFGFLPLFLMILLPMMAKRRNCPRCSNSLDVFQSPFKKTKRQWLHGGYTCTSCGAEIDPNGNLVENAKSSDIPSPVLVGSLMFLTAVVVPCSLAIFMLMAITQG